MGCCLTIQCMSFIFSFANSSGPFADCQSGSQFWFEILLEMEAKEGCGLLVLGPQLTFSLVVTITVYLYASYLVPKIAYVVWMEITVLSCFLLSVVILSSKVHYGVDVFTTWYTVPLVYFASYGVYKDPNGEQLSKQHNHAQPRRNGLRLHLSAMESAHSHSPIQFPHSKGMTSNPLDLVD